jgi:hypothetical protein
MTRSARPLRRAPVAGPSAPGAAGIVERVSLRSVLALCDWSRGVRS